MSKSWAKGHDAASYKARNQVMQDNQLNNGGRCRLQLPGKCTGIAEQAHHTLGKAVTGNDPTYMIAVCAACNYAIGEPSKYKEPPSHISDGWL